MQKRRSKGFVTLATGDEYYYKLAVNMYLSYKNHGGGTSVCNNL